MRSPRTFIFVVMLLSLVACSPAGVGLPPQYASVTPDPGLSALGTPTVAGTSPSVSLALPTLDLTSSAITPSLEATQAVPDLSTPVSPTAIPLSPAFYEPAGCQTPLNDYSPIIINGVQLSERTYSMLQTAARLYGGEIDVAGAAILPPGKMEADSSEKGEPASGGVVDIAVTSNRTSQVLYTEIEPLVRALRTAGFAAWLWEKPPKNENMEPQPYIHAIAIGDLFLSPQAVAQLTGENGYFRGYSGVLQPDGTPQPDRHGGPVLCQWMVAAGYADLRSSDSEWDGTIAGTAWQDRLRQAALAYLADSPQAADQVARQLKFIDGLREASSLMCGPLAAAILRDAGLLPVDYGPVADLHMYWLADPEVDGRPWSMFPRQDYDLFHFDTPISRFDFVTWPLRPGDFLYTYAIEDGFDHMFIVTEVDPLGRAYTVTNQFQPDHSYRIERLLLYDPTDPAAGVIHNQWLDPELGRTGQYGFDVLRRKGVSLPPGSLYAYTVRPGDTLPVIATRFYSTPAGIAAVDAAKDLSHLGVGQTLLVPVNSTQVPGAGVAGAGVRGVSVSGASVPGASMQSVSTPEVGNLQSQVEASVQAAPSGSWGVYIENLATGDVATFNAEQKFHPASTIKLVVGIAVFDWLDRHPDIPLTTSPGNGETHSFEQLLHAMLVQSDEKATSALLRFLAAQPGPSLQEQIVSWGATQTSIEPRQSTPADLARLWKRLYQGELLSETSTRYLLSILRLPSAGDEAGIGGGIPDDERGQLAHKNGITFEGGLGVVADGGVMEVDGKAYVIVVIANQVDFPDRDAAMNVITEISGLTYQKFNP